MPSDPRDFKLDISSAGSADAATPDGAAAARPFLSVHFACCSIYTRIYRSPDGQTYRGRCPRCGQAVQFRVGEGGTDSRCFVVR
jgi:hypothetical protein